jgi:hypothetical protein
MKVEFPFGDAEDDCPSEARLSSRPLGELNSCFRSVRSESVRHFTSLAGKSYRIACHYLLSATSGTEMMVSANVRISAR